MCALWALYVFRPVLRATSHAESERTRLEEEKRGLLFAIRDAEADHVAGKLSDEDHARARDALERRAARIIAALDALPDAGGTSVTSLEGALRRLRERGAVSGRGRKGRSRATVKVDDA